MINETKMLFLEEFLDLGMDFHTSCLAAELTEEEEEMLADDEGFQRKVAISSAVLEKKLLIRHDEATSIAESRGQGQSAIQWRLGVVNPARYSGKDNGDSTFTGKVVINMISGEESQEKILECPECTSSAVREDEKEIWCNDCGHRIKKDSEYEKDNPFLRYAVIPQE